MLTEQLKSLASHLSICEIYGNAIYPDSFSCGWLLDANNHWVSLLEINKQGAVDSNALIKTSSIFKVGIDTPYLHRILVERHDIDELTRMRMAVANFESKARELVKSGRITTISVSTDEKVAAKIVQLDENHIRYRAYSALGVFEGEEICAVESVLKIEWQGPSEVAIERRIQIHGE